MKEDRERCLQAGMDAYISKPIERELLFETIDKLTGVPMKPNSATRTLDPTIRCLMSCGAGFS